MAGVSAYPTIEIKITSLVNVTYVTMMKDATFLEMIRKLLEDPKFLGCAIVRPDKEILKISNVTEKISEYSTNGKLDLKLILSLSPKNDFVKIDKILWIYEKGLQHTTNLENVDIVNLAPFGSFNGFGNGPLDCEPHDDNRLKNLIFVIYEDQKPYAYNICSLRIREDNTTLLVHMNRRFGNAKYDREGQTLYIKESDFVD